MGVTSSVSLTLLDAVAIASCILKLGNDYNIYCDTILQYNINGSVIAEASENDFLELILAVGITNPEHQAKVFDLFRSCMKDIHSNNNIPSTIDATTVDTNTTVTNNDLDKMHIDVDDSYSNIYNSSNNDDSYIIDSNGMLPSLPLPSPPSSPLVKMLLENIHLKEALQKLKRSLAPTPSSSSSDLIGSNYSFFNY